MANMNKVIVAGYLTRDIELKKVGASSVAEFGIATNRKYKKGEEWVNEVCFVDITVWGSQGENCAKYLRKGSGALVDGRLNFQSWEKDGVKRSKLTVVANNVQFLDRASEGSGQFQPKANDLANSQPIPRFELLKCRHPEMVQDDIPF